MTSKGHSVWLDEEGGYILQKGQAILDPRRRCALATRPWCSNAAEAVSWTGWFGGHPAGLAVRQHAAELVSH
eukprot:1556332-Amphidinium_carterae.1